MGVSPEGEPGARPAPADAVDEMREEGVDLDTGRGFARRQEIHDVRDELPRPGTCERRLARPGIELMKKLRPELDEEEGLGRDSVGGAPFAPVGRLDLDLEVHEARGQRRRHAVGDAAVALAVATGHDRGAFRQLVLAALAVAHELEQRGLHHRHAGGELLQVDQVERGAVRGRQEVGRRPAGAVVAVAPGDAA